MGDRGAHDPGLPAMVGTIDRSGLILCAQFKSFRPGLRGLQIDCHCQPVLGKICEHGPDLGVRGPFCQFTAPQRALTISVDPWAWAVTPKLTQIRAFPGGEMFPNDGLGWLVSWHPDAFLLST